MITKGEVWLRVYLSAAFKVRIDDAIKYADAISSAWAERFPAGPEFAGVEVESTDWQAIANASARRFAEAADDRDRIADEAQRLAAQLIDAAETVNAMRDRLAGEDRLTSTAIVDLRLILERP